MKKLMILLFTFITTSIMAASNYDVEFSCVIEGHGGGCGTEYVKLAPVEGAAKYIANITAENCYEDEYEDFCHTYNVSTYESTRLDLLKLALDKRDSGLLLTEGKNEIRVNFRDANDRYITTQFVNINASSTLDY